MVSQVSKQVAFAYKGMSIEFEVINGEVFANATAMCQAFGKRPSKWLELDTTKRYIVALQAKSENRTLVETRHGGANPGTWVHEKLILKLAQWLDVEFEIWCDERISEIIKAANEPEKDSNVLVLESHTKRPVQVSNSKAANGFSFAKGGVEAIRDWSINIVKEISGRYPGELKRYGRQRGLKSKQCSSGKEVVRNLYPDKAAGISIGDYLYSHGVEDREAINLAKSTLPLFQKLIEIRNKVA